MIDSIKIEVYKNWVINKYQHEILHESSPWEDDWYETVERFEIKPHDGWGFRKAHLKTVEDARKYIDDFLTPEGNERVKKLCANRDKLETKMKILKTKEEALQKQIDEIQSQLRM